ncbi:uncharacterized protein F5147DRAFT_780901 [Suillus discolor]|uniref:Uncharacterized protein n=1 Tax=Suillus discolor TaxID=1912936 RepID=A0A9P7JLV7_9AGAM|nr:uncharacterized protein F5147DRAFT_780901 [Suillus discolor]KAG2088660.1 hypothetical protein F5147DRAFT_780901 [Suillus discolor]
MRFFIKLLVYVSSEDATPSLPPEWDGASQGSCYSSCKVDYPIGIEDSGLEKQRYHAAVANAYRFIKTLDTEGGVDLLLFCVRAGRITTALQSNHGSFMNSSHKKVPIVIATTNLEQRMEDCEQHS